MADTCLWRSWKATIEWDPTVPPDVRTRLTAFLQPVWTTIADLAAAVSDATDDDLIAVLGPHVLHVPGPAPDPTLGALAGLVADRLEAALDGPEAHPLAETHLRIWFLAINHALAGKAVAVQWAIVALFLERVLRARLAGPEADDRDRLDHAAEVLAGALNELLQNVSSRAIPPEAYHVM